MYQTVVSSPVVVKIISGYQANGQYQNYQSQNQSLALSLTPPSPAPPPPPLPPLPPSPRQQSPCNHQPYFINTNTEYQQGHHLIQPEVYHSPVEVYPMMSVEMPHIRRHGFGPQVAMPFSMNQNYQRRHYNSHYDCNTLTIPPPHLNFRQNGNTNFSIKKPNWPNNKQRKNSQKNNFINVNGNANANVSMQKEQMKHYHLFPIRPQITPTSLSPITPPTTIAPSISSTASSSSASSSSSKTDNYCQSDSGTNSPSPTPSKNQRDNNYDDKTILSNFQSNVSNNNNYYHHHHNHHQQQQQYDNLTFTQHHLSPYVTSPPQYLQYYYHQQQQLQQLQQQQQQQRLRQSNYYSSFLQSTRMIQQNYYNNKKYYDNNNNKKNNNNNNNTSSTITSTTTSSRCKKTLAEIFISPVNFTNRIIPPDQFLNKSHLMQVYDTPINLTNDCQWDNLSIDIWNKFIKSQQSEKTYKDKILLWKGLYLYFKQTYPKYRLHLVGSTVNGFGYENSDVDLCLIVTDNEQIERHIALCQLDELSKKLSECSFIDKCDLIEAKIPILKFHDSLHCLDVDLNCNNPVGIRNTHMLYCYSQIDWRVRPLIIVIKLWAHVNGINDARNMTLSSYSLTLMVIHFLQSGVKPAVLPCLHQLYPNKFNSQSNIKNIDIHENLKLPYRSNEQINRQSLGELFYQFFHYYHEFNFDKYAISVRVPERLYIQQCRFAIALKNSSNQWNLICIEEPFDLTNTARSVYDIDKFQLIKKVFSQSFKELDNSGNLDSIFQQLNN